MSYELVGDSYEKNVSLVIAKIPFAAKVQLYNCIKGRKHREGLSSMARQATEVRSLVETRIQVAFNPPQCSHRRDVHF